MAISLRSTRSAHNCHSIKDLQCPSYPKSKRRAAASRRRSAAASSARSWFASRGCAGACRGSLPRTRRRSARARAAAAREVPAVRARARHDDPAPGHVGQPAAAAERDRHRALHDHVDIVLDSGLVRALQRSAPLRQPAVDAARIRCSIRCSDRSRRSRCRPQFNGAYLARAAAKDAASRSSSCIMNGQVVVGVGNIYASEALFRAGIRPRRAAGRI